MAQYGLVLLEEKDSLELRCQVVNRGWGGLDRTSTEKEQAAQYGLVLLEERRRTALNFAASS